jgi:hypothetical protein
MFFISRLTLVSGLKWVDEVIPNAPYEITEEFMNTLFNKYNIDYIIHGDDPCLLPDGTDAYALAKKAGRYKQIKRTEGVSSTDIVGKMIIWISKIIILFGTRYFLVANRFEVCEKAYQELFENVFHDHSRQCPILCIQNLTWEQFHPTQGGYC